MAEEATDVSWKLCVSNKLKTVFTTRGDFRMIYSISHLILQASQCTHVMIVPAMCRSQYGLHGETCEGPDGLLV